MIRNVFPSTKLGSYIQSSRATTAQESSYNMILNVNSSFSGKQFNLQNIQYHEDPLINKIATLIEKNLEDETFNANVLCKLMCMSRTNLYYKVKKQSGQSVSNLIKVIRLRKAAALLANNKLNVTEVMNLVGISSPSYFTRFFKKAYGVPPSQFAKSSF